MFASRKGVRRRVGPRGRGLWPIPPRDPALPRRTAPNGYGPRLPEGSACRPCGASSRRWYELCARGAVRRGHGEALPRGVGRGLPKAHRNIKPGPARSAAEGVVGVCWALATMASPAGQVAGQVAGWSRTTTWRRSRPNGAGACGECDLAGRDGAPRGRLWCPRLGEGRACAIAPPTRQSQSRTVPRGAGPRPNEKCKTQLILLPGAVAGL